MAGVLLSVKAKKRGNPPTEPFHMHKTSIGSFMKLNILYKLVHADQDGLKLQRKLI